MAIKSGNSFLYKPSQQTSGVETKKADIDSLRKKALTSVQSMVNNAGDTAPGMYYIGVVGAESSPNFGFKADAIEFINSAKLLSTSSL